MAMSSLKRKDQTDSETLRERMHDRTEALHDKAQQPTTVHGHPMQMGDIFKFAGLIAFFAIMALLVFLLCAEPPASPWQFAPTTCRPESAIRTPRCNGRIACRCRQSASRRRRGRVKPSTFAPLV